MEESGDHDVSVVLEGVSKRYGNFLALNDVSFRASTGDIFGYIGPNGAGKTTTIRIIVGLLCDFQGKLSIGDRLMPEGRSEVHKMVGYLPQNVAFQDWRTVDQTLKIFGKLSGLDEREVENRIREVLELVDLSHEGSKKVSQLSGGMIQKLGLAQALLHRPRLLILDEPLGGLDPASRFQVKQMIVKLSKGGTTVFFSSHILSDVQDIATKIGILNRGRIMQIGTLEELKSRLSAENDLEIVLSYDSGRWKKLGSLKGIKRIEQPVPNKLIAHIDGEADVDDMIDDLIKQLIALGCKIRSFSPVSPSLDEVYLKYVQDGENT